MIAIYSVLVLTVAGAAFPDSATEYLQQGYAAWEKKDYALAEKKFTLAIAAQPGFAPAHYYRGLAYREMKLYDKAIADFTTVLKLDGATAEVHYNRGIAYSQKNDLDKALKDFTEAGRLKPTHTAPMTGRATVFAQQQKYDKAIAVYRDVIRIAPKRPVAYNNLAWLLATCPIARFRDGKEAVKLATRASELTERKRWRELGTLGAAYAEAGDFEKAIHWQQKAIDLGEQDDAELKKAKLRLKLYREKKPFRQK